MRGERTTKEAMEGEGIRQREGKTQAKGVANGMREERGQPKSENGARREETAYRGTRERKKGGEEGGGGARTTKQAT